MSQEKIRLHIDHPLGAGQALPLTEGQANYLFAVMRLGVGETLAVFNGRDGVWRARVERAAKRNGVLLAEAQIAPQIVPPDLWLIFAPLKKARTDFLVEKAVELGVRRLLSVQTRFTNAERLRADKAQAHAVEAAEQCGACFVPEVAELQLLDRLLAGWPADRRILWGDESLAGIATVLADAPRGPWAILIGPEGGFSEDERARLRAHPQVMPASLGPRVLRAETAALAAITLWQAALGDWA